MGICVSSYDHRPSLGQHDKILKRFCEGTMPPQIARFLGHCLSLGLVSSRRVILYAISLSSTLS